MSPDLNKSIMAQVVGVDQDNLACDPIDGGIVVSYAWEYSDVSAAVFGANGEITGITVAVAAGKFTYDDDDSAFYNQVGERDGRKHTFTQEAFMKFSGFEAVKVGSLNALADLCNMVWIHFLSTGESWIQGLEDDGTGTRRRSKQAARATVSHNTNTGDGVAASEVTVTSVANSAHMTTLTTTAVEALP